MSTQSDSNKPSHLAHFKKYYWKLKTFWEKYGRMFGRPLMCNFETELNPDIEVTSIWLHRKSCLPTMEMGKTSLFYKWYKIIKAGRHCYVTTKAQKRISSPNGLSFLSLWDCPRTLVSHSFMDIIFQICTWNIGRFKTSQGKKNKQLLFPAAF